MIAFIRMDEASGTRADSHNSNDFNDNSSVGQTTGASGNCADFTPPDYLDIADASASPAFDGMTDFGFSVWFNLDTTSGLQTVMSKYGSGTSQFSYLFRIASGGGAIYCLFYDGSNYSDGNVSYTFSTGTWYNFTVSFDGSAGTIDTWINGVGQTQISGSASSVQNSTTPVFFGAANNTAGTSESPIWQFNGQMQTGVFFSQTLDSSNATWLHNSGTPREYADFSGGGGGGGALSQAVIIS